MSSVTLSVDRGSGRTTTGRPASSSASGLASSSASGPKSEIRNPKSEIRHPPRSGKKKSEQNMALTPQRNQFHSLCIPQVRRTSCLADGQFFFRCHLANGRKMIEFPDTTLPPDSRSFHSIWSPKARFVTPCIFGEGCVDWYRSLCLFT